MLFLLTLLPLLTACKCGERNAAQSAALQPNPPAVQSQNEPAPSVVTPPHGDARDPSVREAEGVDAVVAAIDAVVADVTTAKHVQPVDAVIREQGHVIGEHRDVSAELDALLRDLNALEASLAADRAQNARLLRELGDSGATRTTERRRVRARSVPSKEKR